MKPLNPDLYPDIVFPEDSSTPDIIGWRQFLKYELLRKRKWRSDFSGRSLIDRGCDMHEGIITRAVLRSGVWWHYQIYHEYNCFLLLREEHIPKAPSRQWAVQTAYERYGRDNVREWFYSLPFKVRPFQLI